MIGVPEVTIALILSYSGLLDCCARAGAGAGAGAGALGAGVGADAGDGAGVGPGDGVFGLPECLPCRSVCVVVLACRAGQQDRAAGRGRTRCVAQNLDPTWLWCRCGSSNCVSDN